MGLSQNCVTRGEMRVTIDGVIQRQPRGIIDDDLFDAVVQVAARRLVEQGVRLRRQVIDLGVAVPGKVGAGLLRPPRQSGEG